MSLAWTPSDLKLQQWRLLSGGLSVKLELLEVLVTSGGACHSWTCSCPQEAGGVSQCHLTGEDATMEGVVWTRWGSGVQDELVITS